ncbi:hypothetical protein BX600DRAFT_469987, partial [Xylariales sp. PMI_506]
METVPSIASQLPWKELGEYFLGICLSTRAEYDFPNDTSLEAIVSSFWFSTSFLERNDNCKTWIYL